MVRAYYCEKLLDKVVTNITAHLILRVIQSIYRSPVWIQEISLDYSPIGRLIIGTYIQHLFTELMIGVFIDLEKTFGTTWRYTIIQQVYRRQTFQNLSVASGLVFWSFFTWPRRGNHLNREKTVASGFSAEQNAVYYRFHRHVYWKCLHVDDLALFYSSSSTQIIKLQGAANKFTENAEHGGICFSAPKTTCVHFCRKRVT